MRARWTTARAEHLESEFDGWMLHTHAPGLRMLEHERILPDSGVRVCQWVKGFAALKRNVPVPMRTSRSW